MVGSVIQLKCSCNNYPWGKKGYDSLAARLCAGTPSGFKIDDDKEYAEMWIGTYPTTPSYVLGTGELLQEVINANADKLVGKSVLDKYGKDLPFLPKILSIASALPLQLHPSRALATALHKKDPSKFGDPNHKPEIAIALSDFEVFINFKPFADIDSLLQLEPLKTFRPTATGAADEQGDLTTQGLKQLCRSLLTAAPETVKSTVTALSHLPPSSFPDHQRHVPPLLPRLQAQYSPSDNGILVALICMNYLLLHAGQAIYVPPNGLHAYLSGDIVECMARSDNVLNSGFCPRADRDDLDLFVDTVRLETQHGEDALLIPTISERGSAGKTKLYAPPLAEFDMLVTTLEAGEREQVDKVEGPSVLIVVEGEGRMRIGGGGDGGGEESMEDVREGFVFFVGKGVKIGFETAGNTGKRLVVYRAFAE